MSYDPQQYNPYGSPQQRPPQGGQYDPYGRKPSGGSGLMWLWILLGGGGLVFLVCCGSCCGLAYYGMEEEEQQLQAMFGQDPTVVEHLGPLTSVDRDWGASLEEDDDSIWYYNVQGEKADGVIIIREGPFDIDSDDLDLEWAKLRLESGEELDIYP